MSHFTTQHIKGLDELRKQYYKLAKELHPDVGGNEVEFKQMQSEYEELVNSFLRSGKFSKEEIRSEIELDEAYKHIIDGLAQYPAITIELIGSWIWVSGMTYPVRSTLKELGFMFAPQKKMWYINTTGKKTKKGKEMDIDAIRTKYGSKAIKTAQERKRLEGLGEIAGIEKKRLKASFSRLIKAMNKRYK
jgi:curved DNA-binding protein CbpA